MIRLPWLLLIGALASVLWVARRIPLAGIRKAAATASRLLAVAALCGVLWGISYQRTRQIPRRVLYLVDRSQSLDEQQASWIAMRIASLESLRPQAVERAIVVFGANGAVAVPVGTERMTDPAAITRAMAEPQVDRAATNLETGMLAGLTLADPGRHTSLVLFSDGQETTGNVTELLSFVRRLGVDAYPVAPPVYSSAKASWEDLTVPPVVQRGSTVPVQLVVRNASARAKTGQVTVAIKGVAIKRQAVAIPPGWHVVSVPVPAVQRGTMPLDVTLAIPEDGMEEQRTAYTEVEGPPQVLLVTDRAGVLPALATALKRHEMDVALARTGELPTDASRLLNYDAVVLFNTPKSLISEAQARALQTFVQESGSGLITIGLGGDLAHELNTPSPIDALLPVRFEPKGLEEAKRRVCMVMLIDRSASMIGPRIAATKRAAVELVKQLAPEDLVGVLAFDTQPYVVAEVQQAGQLGPSLIEKLVKLKSTGGTDIYPALAAAANRLQLTGARVKHVILLSDGNTPFNEKAYGALIESFRLDGISVSTIGIGSVFVNVDYLRWLAGSTGGTYYEMRTLEQLPQLIAKDTQESLGRLPFTEGYFHPSRAPGAEWFAEQAEFPSLRGFLTATAKPGALVELTVGGAEAEEPLMARWHAGRGRVVSFTSDADARWSPEWIRWNSFDAVWTQVVRWAMRPRLTEELFVRIEEQRGAPRMIIEGEFEEPRGTLVSGDGGMTVPLPLVQTGPWRWHASLEEVPSGWYQLVLESRPNGVSGAGEPGVAQAAEPGLAMTAKRWIRIGTPPTAKEATGQPPREALLRQLARATAGAYDTPDLAFVPPTTRTVTREPLVAWLIPLAILALLLDIALRGSTML